MFGKSETSMGSVYFDSHQREESLYFDLEEREKSSRNLAGPSTRHMTMENPSQLLSKRRLSVKQNSHTFRRPNRRMQFTSSLRNVMAIKKKGEAISLKDQGYPGFLTEMELDRA
eukprot:9918434-Ditylum_brightwellii.AAC.1